MWLSGVVLVRWPIVEVTTSVQETDKHPCHLAAAPGRKPTDVVVRGGPSQMANCSRNRQTSLSSSCSTWKKANRCGCQGWS